MNILGNFKKVVWKNVVKKCLKISVVSPNIILNGKEPKSFPLRSETR